MKLTFLGASETVTGSKILLNYADKNYLIDCGMYQGSKELSLLNEKLINVSVQSIDNVFITHGHLDHCGYLPILYKNGYKGKIFCTPLTKEIIKIILEDALKVQEYDLKEQKIKEPLFTEIDVAKVFANFQTFEKGKEFKLDDLSFQFFEAGHIIGASSLLLKNSKESLCFSGDIGRADDLLHYPPSLPSECQTLVLESTYGDRDHENNDLLYNKLSQHIQRIIETQGVLLIPAFAVARTQIILKVLGNLFDKNPELKLPLFVDSPMASKVTKLYLENHKALKLGKAEMLDFLAHCKFLDYGKDQKRFSKQKGPFIIVSSSGMISGGRVLKYFDMYAKHEKNTILLAGYQGEGTIGRRILDGEDRIKLFGHEIHVRSHLDFLPGMSAHADRGELLGLLKEIKGLKRIYLNHGEKETLPKFKEYLEQLNVDTIIAKKNKTYKLENE